MLLDLLFLFKIQQERAWRYSKSSKRENGATQNPARESMEVLKIQQERGWTTEWSCCRALLFSWLQVLEGVVVVEEGVVEGMEVVGGGGGGEEECLCEL